MSHWTNIFKKKAPKVWDLKGETVSAIASLIQDYSKWYAEHGIYLPPEFEQDPSSWTEVLRKMSRAFELLQGENDPEGELYIAKHKWDSFGEIDSEEVKALEAEIIEGSSLFGRYLYFMKDDKKIS